MSSDAPHNALQDILQALVAHINNAHQSTDSEELEKRCKKLEAKQAWLNNVAARIVGEQDVVAKAIHDIHAQIEKSAAAGVSVSVAGGAAAAAAVTGGAVTTNGATMSVTGGSDAAVGGAAAKTATLGSKTGGKGKGKGSRKKKSKKTVVTKKKSRTVSRKKASAGKK